MAPIEFEGKNTEEAIAKACASLDLPVEELKFSIITTGSSGIFGLGGRKAKIRVEPPAEPPPAEPAIREPAAPLAGGPQALAPAGPEGGAEPGPLPPEKPAGPGFQNALPPGWPNLDLLEIPPPPTQAGPGESVQAGEPDALTRQSLETLARILKLMGFEAELSAVRIANRIIINIGCREHGLLIGKKGATLDALQFLTSKMVLKEEESEIQIIVDIENYRLRRHEAIIALARSMAEKARRGGRPVVINQLSSSERRIVHLMLKNAPGLRTKSRGDGLFKSLVIIPAAQGSGHLSGGDEGLRNEPGSAP